MTQAIRYIQLFTANLSFEDYLNDIRAVSAVERQFEIYASQEATLTSKPFLHCVEDSL